MARIRSSARGETDALAAAARDIDFRHLWRQLRAAGWSAKRPSGIQTEWSYVSPDGADSFVGEDAVVVFAIESGLLEDIETGTDEAKDDIAHAAAHQDCSDSTAEDVRPSQIDTAAALSQNTMDALFGPENDSDLSQAAVARAFDVSHSELEGAASDHEAATNLQLLSEVSGAESDGKRNDEVGQTPARVLRPRANLKKGVNFVPEDETLSVYESFSSGEGEGDELCHNEGCGGAEDSEEDTVVSETDAVALDEAFVESLLLGADAMSKSATQQRADALRGMTWSLASGSFEEGVTLYPGLNMEEAQPVQELRSQCHSPLLTFFYFLPKSLWVTINVETNRYCQQRINERAQAQFEQQGPRSRETFTQIRRMLQGKPGYQTHEILQVIGRHLRPVHGAKSLPGHLRDLHFVDNESDHGRDKLWKLRPVVDKLQQRFLDGWSLPAVFSFNEGVLPSTSK